MGHIKELRVLGYADDAALVSWRTEEMTQRLTTLADAAIEQADMKVKLTKTYTQKVSKQKPVAKATSSEIQAKMKTYPHECEFAGAGCTARFKTARGMHIHRARCQFRYYFASFTKYEVETVVDVFGHSARRLFKVQWRGYPGEDSWEPEHNLLAEGCKTAIDEFWLRSNQNPARDYYPDRDGGHRCWICGWMSKGGSQRMLKSHITKSKHQWNKKRACTTARRDIEIDKLTQQQLDLSQVRWGERDVKN